MSLEALQVGVVEHLDGGIFDGAVHPLGLAVGPGMIRLRQLVGDPVLTADPVEDVPDPGRRWPIAVLGQVSERSANAMAPDQVRGRLLSVRTVWIAYGNTATTARRKAAPFILVAASKNATWVN